MHLSSGRPFHVKDQARPGGDPGSSHADYEQFVAAMNLAELRRLNNEGNFT
jgi:hypothetical protein